MKALVCREFGPIDALAVLDVPDPVPGPGQVLVRVSAAGVNFPDALIVQGKYQYRPPLPFVPGVEAAGTVTAVGEGVQHVRPGDPVVAVCGLGAFAESVVAAADSVLPLPPGLDVEHAAALPLTYGTVYHALLDRAHLRQGETLLVLGAGGGIGIAAVELGKLMGATVIAAASSQEKLQAAADRGADHLVNYAEEDLRARLREITRGGGVDVVCDPVGGPHAEAALRSTGWNGRYLVVGFAAGTIPQIALNIPLLKGSAVVGVFWGEFRRREPQRAREELERLIEWAWEDRLRPLITARHALIDGREALYALLERRATGKQILRP
ncbi:MAG: NADPH:quinone oxidoreductase family protein [Pseudomonadota bacterium]|jgi:NADPH:quinone reductase and related Zn-dependent oxidoreductases|nr:MAG: NADPH:quinone oxidoreductase [Pseudomonadota bacterium]